MKKLFYSMALVFLTMQIGIAQITVGAEHFEAYRDILKNKSVGVVVNHTSMVKNQHLIDFFISQKIDIKVIFTPEHGLQGVADAGETIKDGKYKNEIPIYSLYGSNKKPTPEQLKGIDVLVFDIQDVGARFYTYISTMHYAMEACAESNISFLVLDRPNPNGMFIEGPVRKEEFKSFVGMHPIPVLHGLTVGELAQMINGEKWLKNGVQCKLEIIKCENYTHDSSYDLPIKPSPNLPNGLAVRLYPSLCLFEGTQVSLGRGTYAPFQQVGSPFHKDRFEYSFTPVSIEGMSKQPDHENTTCFGKNLANSEIKGFDISLLIEFYTKSNDKSTFFNRADFFDKLAGNSQLRTDIIAGKSKSEIENSWKTDLENYKKMRKKYLIYE